MIHTDAAAALVSDFHLNKPFKGKLFFGFNNIKVQKLSLNSY